MSPTVFYKAQADEQQRAADDAVLENVRDRCQRASNAWSQLAARSERTDKDRVKNAGSQQPDERDVRT